MCTAGVLLGLAKTLCAICHPRKAAQLLEACSSSASMLLQQLYLCFCTAHALAWSCGRPGCRVARGGLSPVHPRGAPRHTFKGGSSCRTASHTCVSRAGNLSLFPTSACQCSCTLHMQCLPVRECSAQAACMRSANLPAGKKEPDMYNQPQLTVLQQNTHPSLDALGSNHGHRMTQAVQQP